MDLTFAGLLAVAMMAPAFAQDPKTLAHEQTFHRSVQAGGEVRVFTYARWTKKCVADAPPGIEILTPAARGTASLRPGQVTVRSVREGEPSCIGQTYPGLSIWYVAQPGFIGTDRFDWQVTGANSTSHDTAVIEVR
jgi:hypothetical protein